MRARTGAGTGARIEIRVEGRASPGTYEVEMAVDPKTREGEPTNNQQLQSHDAEDQSPETGSGGQDRGGRGGEGKKRKKPQKSYRREMEKRGDSGEGRTNVDMTVLVQLMSTQKI